MRINENNVDIIGKTFGVESTPPLRPVPTKKLTDVPKSLNLLHFVQQLREQNLVLDFALLSEPFINQGTILMKSHGEISWY